MKNYRNKSCLKMMTAAVLSFALASCAAAAGRLQVDLSGQWMVEDINHRGIIDSSHITLDFLPAGQLTGDTGCNRMKGSYRITGSRIEVGPVSHSRKICAPALMNQQSTYVHALSSVRSYRMDETGALILEGAHGISILARRP